MTDMRYQPTNMVFVLHENWSDAAAWDDFVLRHAEGRFCHLFKYSETVRCDGYRPRRIAFTYRDAQRYGEIAALLPFTETSNYGYGHRLISQPFCEYGGLLLDPRLSAVSVNLIIEMLQHYLAAAMPLAVLEIHGNLGVPPEQRDLFVQRNPHLLALLPLVDGADHVWNKIIKYEVRKAVNQARRADITVVQECNQDVIRQHFSRCTQRR